MGYDTKSRELLPDGLGEYFPTFITHRAAIDKSIIDLMCALSEIGVRPEQFSALLLELASKQYHRDYKQREHHVKRCREKTLGQAAYMEGVMFSDFCDKKKYCGATPSPKYLTYAYKLYHATISHHMDREVKKRGATYLRWDVSYKEGKKLF